MMVHDDGARTGGEVLVFKTKQHERRKSCVETETSVGIVKC